MKYEILLGCLDEVQIDRDGQPLLSIHHSDDGAPFPLTLQEAEDLAKRICAMLEDTAEANSANLLSALKCAVNLIGSAYAHVSHGGPTRADAERVMRQAQAAIAEAEGRS